MLGRGEGGMSLRCQGGPIHLSQGRRPCLCKVNRNNPLIIYMAGLVFNMSIFVSNITGFARYGKYFFLYIPVLLLNMTIFVQITTEFVLKYKCIFSK